MLKMSGLKHLLDVELRSIARSPGRRQAHSERRDGVALHFSKLEGANCKT
jgi:hypothetical protein